MPKILVDIPDVEVTFVRPSIINIIKDLMERTYFPPTDKIFYLSEVHSVPLPGSTIGEGNEFRTTGSDNSVKISVTEDYNDIDITNMSHPSNQTPSIFLNNDLGVSVKTLYTPVKYRIDITVRFNSLSKAKSWVQRHLISTRLGRTSLVHNAVGSYPIPNSIMLLLSDIHAKASMNDPAIATAKEWFDSNITPRKVLTADQAGNKTRLMISDSAANIIGGFDFDKAPEEIRKLDNNSFTAELSYNIRLEKPVMMLATFPLVVNNKPIDSAFTQTKVPMQLNRETIRGDRIIELSNHFSQYISGYNDAKGLSVPYYDDWCPDVFTPCCVPVMRMQALVSPTDLKDVVNINQLGEFGTDGDSIEINADLLTFLAPYHEGIVKQYGAPLNIALYKGNHQLSDPSLTIDNLGNIRTVDDMDLKANYHLVISLMIDMRTMDINVKEALRKDPVFFIKLCDVIYPKLRENMLEDQKSQWCWDTRSDGSLSKAGFSEILHRGAMMYRKTAFETPKLSKTIMAFTINARSL